MFERSSKMRYLTLKLQICRERSFLQVTLHPHYSRAVEGSILLYESFLLNSTPYFEDSNEFSLQKSSHLSFFSIFEISHFYHFFDQSKSAILIRLGSRGCQLAIFPKLSAKSYVQIVQCCSQIKN